MSATLVAGEFLPGSPDINRGDFVTACGVLTTGFKINFLAPAAGDRIVARARVVKAGRTLTVAQSEVFAGQAGQEKLIALLTRRIMTVQNRDGVTD